MKYTVTKQHWGDKQYFEGDTREVKNDNDAKELLRMGMIEDSEAAKKAAEDEAKAKATAEKEAAKKAADAEEKAAKAEEESADKEEKAAPKTKNKAEKEPANKAE